MAESPTMEVRARLTADSAQFTQGMDKAVKSANEFQQASNKLKSSITGIGIASGTAIAGLIAFGMKSFKAAAEVERLDLALQAVGASSGKGYESLKTASDAMRTVGIQAAQAQKTTLKFAQSNIDLSKSADIARVAQDLSVASSMSGEEALSALTLAITTTRTQTLRQVGITTDASTTFQRYASSIGKAAKDLTMGERRQAVMNLVLEEGSKAAGAFALSLQSPAKLIEEFSQLNKELQVTMGGALLKGFGPIIKSAYGFQAAIVRAVGSGGKLENILGALEKVFVKLTTPISMAFDKLTEFIDGMDLTGTKVNDLAGKFEMLLPVIAGLGTAFATMAGQTVFGSIPVFGKLLTMLNPVAVGLVAVAMTSTQVQSAMGRLLQSLQPLLTVAKNVATVFGQAMAIAIAIVAKAINGLASVIQRITTFFQNNARATQILVTSFASIATVVALATVAFYANATALRVVAFSKGLLQVATVLLTGGQLASIASTNGLAASMLRLNAVIAANPIMRAVLIIGALVSALVVAYKTSENFRKVVGMVFNFVAKVVLTVLAYIIQYFGHLMKAQAQVMRVFGFFAEVVAKVFEFVMDVILTWYKFILTAFKNVIDGFVSLMETNEIFRKVIVEVFNAVLRVIALAVTVIVTSFANILKAIATGVYIFEKFFEVVKMVAKGVIGGVFALGKGIVGIFGKIATGMGDFLDNALTTVKEWVQKVTAPLMKIPLVSTAVSGALGALSGMAAFASSKMGGVASSLTNLFKGSEDASAKSIDAISGVSKTLISNSKSWGNYSSGAAGAISGIANKMLDFNMKLVDFAKQDNGSKIVEGLITGAKKVSPILEKMIDGIGKVIKFDFAETVGKFIDSVADKAEQAGDKLIEFGSKMLVFANTADFAGELGDFISSIKENLEEGLGFGDILAKEKEKAEAVTKGGVDEQALADLQGSADLMAKIREAMKAGIESMSDVLKDLQQAAKDFADSLKDTILGFAGLKGVELPDGFIPQAKSLIENMQTRLNKSNQFAQQITQLQALGLDAKAIQDLVESGPIKGAQLAASILGGGADAIKQINEIQRAISITGAAIGKFGSEAAFGDKIANAQLKLAQVTDAEARISGVSGNNIVIEQGAFVVNVDTTGATNQDEKADIITQRIQETFAILAKELANK